MMNSKEEAAYLEGCAAAASAILKGVQTYLPQDAREAALAAREIVDTRKALRSLLVKLDLEDQWEPHLYLSDIVRRIEKALP